MNGSSGSEEKGSLDIWRSGSRRNSPVLFSQFWVNCGAALSASLKVGHRLSSLDNPEVPKQKISLSVISYLTARQAQTTLPTVMNLACAEPDRDWGQRPCEGLGPSTLTCVWAGLVAARRTHPGMGAAWKGSNVADRNPQSYGGQSWPDMRSSKNARRKSSSPAAASEKSIAAAVHLDRRCVCHAGLRPADVLVGMIDVPFTAPEEAHV